MQKRPIIFLDLDGVLNCEKSQSKLLGTNMLLNGANSFHKSALVNLQIVLDETDADIVISSSWRYSYDATEIEMMLWYRCVKAQVVGITPRRYIGSDGIYKPRTRGEEIQLWLDANPDVTNYCIIDDDTNMLEHQLPHFVETTWENGFDSECRERALNIISK